MPDHWTQKMYNELKKRISAEPELKSNPKMVNCIVNNIVAAYKNPQSIKSEKELTQTVTTIMLECRGNKRKDPGAPDFSKKTHIEPKDNSKHNSKGNSTGNGNSSPGIAESVFNNCVNLAKKQPPYNCEHVINTCAMKKHDCVHDNNCLNDVSNLAQNYCTQIHGKKLPIRPSSSDNSGFYSYCDEKCTCVKTKGPHPKGHDLYTDPNCSGGCDGSRCNTLHSIKHGVF